MALDYSKSKKFFFGSYPKLKRNLISSVMLYVMMYGFITLVVIFQPEIRSIVLMKSQPLRDFSHNVTFIEALDKAVHEMSSKKVGALIVIERNVSLDKYIATGVTLNATVSQELLVNIFTPNTPLHDGAVIIRDNKIAAANSYLPLTKKWIPQEYGTRHRAGVGVTETTDALVVIVSEETGDLSAAITGKFLLRLTREELLRLLEKELKNEVNFTVK